ncbi:hypothetical protein [Profundibacter amoris]|uniref:Uncharacterized protein n=1 Tax=Profundibacter amoris TaxID=2171755 RepID=A0A347UEG6_9RHOB|nr:hypothetical protein [Profundibacter amoris]AXX97244.1 hypothetical protein BAR1_04425 [Profundibacter amoris]
MKKNSNLDEIADAARLEPGDAKKAWQLLAAHIEGTDLPAWVKAYVQKSAVTVAAFDMEHGDQAKLAHDLGFYKEVAEQDGWSYDLDHIFDWFTGRMMKDVQGGKKISISRTAREYLDENRMFNNSPDGLRKAYEKARKRHVDRMEAGLKLEQLLAERGV